MGALCVRAGVPRYTRYQLGKSAFTNFLKGADLGTTKAFQSHLIQIALNSLFIELSR